MAEVYYKLIKLGLKTINDVPENLKTEVQALIDNEAAN
jgi:hypothetical protein